MITYRYSFTQTLNPDVYKRIERLFHGDISKMINFCRYYFEMFFHDQNIIQEYYIIPEIFGLVDRTKPLTMENVKNSRLHFHGIIYVVDYNLFMKKIYSLQAKLGYNKLNYINCEDRFMKANNYLFKFHTTLPINPSFIDWFSTFKNKLTKNQKVEIWNSTHKCKKEPLVEKVNNSIMSYFQ